MSTSVRSPGDQWGSPKRGAWAALRPCRRPSNPEPPQPHPTPVEALSPWGEKSARLWDCRTVLARLQLLGLLSGDWGGRGCSPSPSDVAEMLACLLNLLPRFFKLHERKCEPIIMTVPRKVSPVLLGLCDLTELPKAGQLTGLMPVFCFFFNSSFPSLTSFRMTSILTQLGPKPPWKPRSGLRGRTPTPSSSP